MSLFPEISHSPKHGLFRKPCVLDVFYVDNIIYNRENNFNLCIVCRPNSALLPPENSSCHPALGYGLAEGFSPVFLRRSSYTLRLLLPQSYDKNDFASRKRGGKLFSTSTTLATRDLRWNLPPLFHPCSMEICRQIARIDALISPYAPEWDEAVD